MSFVDLQTVLGVAQNVFGTGYIANFFAGILLVLSFIGFTFMLGLGFEAIAVLTAALIYGLSFAGFLPVWVLSTWQLGAAFALTILFTMFIRRT